MPNPRGSYGQGEKFTRANVKDFGAGDLRDTLAGVDAAIKKYPMDCHADESFPRRRGRCWRCQLAKLLWPELDRSMDDSVLRRISL